jgi:uncharacterized metal-binding protein YceD (DUF177 family)
MQINVGQLLREHIGTSRSYAVSDIIRKDDAFFHNMEGTINLLRTKRGILVNAHIKAEIEDQCIRCLRTSTFRFN